MGFPSELQHDWRDPSRRAFALFTCVMCCLGGDTGGLRLAISELLGLHPGGLLGWIDAAAYQYSGNIIIYAVTFLLLTAPFALH